MIINENLYLLASYGAHRILNMQNYALTKAIELESYKAALIS